MKNKVLLILAIIVNIIIWINSLIPANISSEQSSFVVSFVYPMFENISDVQTFTFTIRKLAHFTEYFVLALFFLIVYKNKNLKFYYLITLAHALLVAIIDESIQLFIPGRAGLLSDFYLI